MTAESENLRGRLVAIAESYRHVREDHRRARRGGHVRRHLKSRLEALASDFERLLVEAAPDDLVREQWRRHLYHGDAEPDLPAAEPAPEPSGRHPPSNRERGSAPLWQR